MALQPHIEAIVSKEIDPVFAQRARFIFSQVEAQNPAKILDVGCGRGFYVQTLSSYDFVKKIYGLDENLDYLGKAKKYLNKSRVVLTKGNAYALPFPDASFDCVVLSEVLEHLADEQKALAEIFRVLKKGGMLLVTVPHQNFPWIWDPINAFLMKFFNAHVRKDWWWIAGIWADHERLYTEADLRKVFKKARFTVTKLQHTIFYAWPFSHFVLYGIGKNIIEALPFLAFNRFQVQKQSLVGSTLASIMRMPETIATKLGWKKTNGVGLVASLKK